MSSADHGASAAMAVADRLAEQLRSLIRDIPDFPTRGILFRDLTTLFGDADGFRATIDGLARSFDGVGVDHVVGVESRGFIVGGALAYAMGAGFVPVRKQGKLPGDTLARAYSLEYGEAVLEIHRDAIAPGGRVVIVDDLLATGGTAAAAIDLVEQLRGAIAGVAFVVELAELGGARALGGREHVALVSL